ncbi:MAG: alpha/beta fold hydrolase [Gemmatimonadaceae bacterium]|jgi:homoserine O-acetyltransferase|nr:alpha/beta fold hydrolase [Gemmatimonadaceae bacterium]
MSDALPLRQVALERMVLDGRARLDRIDVAYVLRDTHGTLARCPVDRPLVVACPALTGDAPGAAAWAIEALATQGRHDAVVLSVATLGSCTGTRAVPALAADTAVSPRDMATVVVRTLAALGAPTPHVVAGGSLGGMVALEVAVALGAPVHGVVLAAPAAQTPWAQALGHLHREALRLGGPREGLALARAIGMLSYRSSTEFNGRFTLDGARTAVSYLQHHGARLVERFDADAYRRLLDAMDAHDIGRARGGLAAALAPHAARLVGVGIPGDVLYPADDVRGWTEASGARYASITSVHGHDAFLLEPEQVGRILARALVAAETDRRTGSHRSTGEIA